jgi:ATP-dependent helicase/nuclease subunit B
VTDRRLLLSRRAADRLDVARDWLAGQGRARQVLVLAAERGAAIDLVREAAARVGGAFGWRPTTLRGLAFELARPGLAAAGLTPASGLATEAVCARVVASLEPAELERFAAVCETPGLPRALARTLGELRLAEAQADELPPVLRRIDDAFGRALAEAGLADHATVLAAAIERADDGDPSLERPLLLLDLAPSGPLETRLLAALVARSPDVLAVAPDGDRLHVERLAEALARAPERLPVAAGGALARLQRHLFDEAPPEPSAPESSVSLLSAPGEARECVEIARRVQAAAREGVPFDRMAILLRSPSLYRAHLEEALRRAGVPSWFERGVRRPDPAGRALLALLACKAEGLSADRFAEYLSLGQVPPPDEQPVGWVPPGDDEADAPEAERPTAPQPPSPRRWEKLLVNAAVIGGLDRWRRRLDGLKAELQARLVDAEPDSPAAIWLPKKVAELEQLADFALPLLTELDALPERATWGGWLDALTALTDRAIRWPDRILALLGTLAPMASTGPVELAEVRRILQGRLGELVRRPGTPRAGHLFIGPIAAARGRSFDVVFVPGLAERMFPAKVVEDPILLDAERRELSAPLQCNDDRVAAERMALRLAVGAAGSALVLSWPRLDSGRSRPRVPSFYGLEVVRAAEGVLPGFDTLARRAEQEGDARLAHPAPRDPALAIDDAEHDLAWLYRVRGRSQAEAAGALRYLLTANPFLARSLRARYARWSIRRFTEHDGLVKPRPEALAGLAAHRLGERSFSATALQDFAACPYRFFLRSVHHLAPRDEPAEMEYLDPLSRGSLVHETQFELLVDLRAKGLVPITEANLDAVRAEMEATLSRVADRFAERLAPAIPRVWADEIAAIETDLGEWLRRMAEEPVWVPHRFELSFGLKGTDGRDEHSTLEPAVLDCGIRLRGSIDLVEADDSGGIRVTDYKTGRAHVSQGATVEGGAALQPVLYALAAERLFPDQPVDSGRLWYCTTAGGFREVTVPLDDRARAAVRVLADAVGARIELGDLPAFPRKDACEWCDYRPVCGPNEERRAARKARPPVQDLLHLRSLR